jgi:hypothetical protein
VSFGDQPWIFECKGEPRPGDSAGMGTLHVWRRRPDRTAYCLKCGMKLTVEQEVWRKLEMVKARFQPRRKVEAPVFEGPLRL